MLDGLLYSFVPVRCAYIDPGTGSMLFTVLLGAIGVLSYGLKSLWMKLRISAGHKENNVSTYPFVIYSDSKRYWNCFKPVCDEFEKREIQLVYLTQSEDDGIFSESYDHVKAEYIGEGNQAFAKLNFLNADILLSTTPSLDVFQWKRSKDTRYYIHIPHAAGDLTLYRLFGVDYYDSILAAGDYQIKQIRELEKLRDLPPKDMKIVGLTYFDEMKKRIDKMPKPENDVPVVLIAPTWGSNSLLNRFGSRLIDALADTGFKVVIRPHPQSFTSEKELIQDLMNKYPHLEWNRDSDNTDILNKADILISDYSGVIFDFALVFNKPIICADFSFDDSPYDAHWLDQPIWIFEQLPRIGKVLKEEDFSNFKEVINSCLNSSEYARARQLAIRETWANIGKAAGTIADYMIDKQKELTKGSD